MERTNDGSLTDVIFDAKENNTDISAAAFETKKMIIANGTEVAYWEAGDPANQTIVFIHGFTGSKAFWGNYMNAFKEDYHVIAIDMIGHGETVLAECEYNNDSAFAEECNGVLNALGKDKYILVAHSLGGIFIQQYVIKYGCDKLTAIAMMDSAPSLNAPEGFPFPAVGGFGNKEWMLKKDFGDMYNWEFFMTNVAKSNDPKGFETVALHACQQDHREAFVKFNVPTLYLYPDKDTHTMTNSLEMVEWLKAHSDPKYVSYIAVDSDTHMFPLEQYDATLKELKNFFAAL